MMDWETHSITYSKRSMEIKRIQLRGISRSPSDRLTEDGGVAESLNAQLDNSEIAPVIKPTDVTGLLGLPSSLVAERVYVHKTNAAENYIVFKKDGSLGYYTDTKEYVEIVNLSNETILNIASVGNTLIVSSSEKMHYILYANNEYRYLGTKIPEPYIEFRSTFAEEGKDYGHVVNDDNNDTPIFNFDETAWNEALLDIKKGKVTDNTEQVLLIQEQLWASYVSLVRSTKGEGLFTSPVFARYSVRLYDGSYVYQSSPILLGAGSEEYYRLQGLRYAGFTQIVSQLTHPYQAFAIFHKWDIDGWEDIIESIDLFLSTDVNFPIVYSNISKIETNSPGDGSIEATFSFDAQNSSWEDELLSKSNFYKIASFRRDDFSQIYSYDLSKGHNVLSQDDLVVNDRLPDFDQVANELAPERLGVYNGRLLLVGGNKYLPTGYPFIPSLSSIGGTYSQEVAIRYEIATSEGTKYVYARNSNGSHNIGSQYGSMRGLLFYPDVRCKRVTIYSAGQTYSLQMKPHPLLNCSYAYWGIDKALADMSPATNIGGSLEGFVTNEDRKESINNKLFVSESSNPFYFPLSGSKTFESKILGFAIATTALSQGQFGQFPLYVFTEDGIWAMETTDDGRFLSSKPLSRDVCCNADSITSIDNAVVFVTEKGLMLLSGSQVVNLSANMNGRHYRIEEHAKNILSAQNGFEDLSDPLSDSTPFMAFMKKASITYDYAGQRLICIAPDVDYQYVYKIDTQSWHKLFHGKTFVAPINSYPESLLLADEVRVFYWAGASSSFGSDMVRQQLKKYIPDITEAEVNDYLNMQGGIDVTDLDKESKSMVFTYLNDVFSTSPREEETAVSRIYNLSTHLDVSEEQKTERVVIATRPFDLDNPDVLKTIRDIRVRGQFPKGAVKFILQGSQDGITFYTISTLRGKSWKLFRLIILADLDATDRISWVDVGYETRFTNKLR